MSTVIGLSFGNTSSSIAYIKEGTVEVIANQDGDRAIPSMLSYVGGDEYHGLQAKHQLVRNPKSTVAYFRDFLGTSFSRIDPTAAHRSAHPVEKDGKVGFLIPEEEGERFLSIDDAVTRQFVKINEAAVDYLGKAIDGVVLTVPTNFDEAQRKHLSELAGKANLPVLQIINEPTAALFAHVARSDASIEDKLFVVADFGGTRSDGAVIAYNAGVFTILATLHDTELGGRLLDEAVAEFLAAEFEKQHSVNPRSDARAMAKLTLEAEQLRKTLSNSTSASYGIESVTQGLDFSGSLNRLRFEMLARPVFTRFGDFVQKLVTKAGIDTLEVNEVLLAGGVSWTPKIASQISSLFDLDQTVVVSPVSDTRAVAPDELIPRGAAIQGSLISGFDAEEIAESLQAVVVNGPHLTKAVGVVEKDGSVKELLAINTLLPLRKVFTVSADDAKALVKVVEIESEVVVETKKPEPREKTEDDDESDWSDDEDEEYEVRSLQHKAGKVLAELSVEGPRKVELVINIDKDAKLTVAAR